MTLKGIAVSPGISFGNVFIYEPYTPDVIESCFEAGMERSYLDVFNTAVEIADAQLTKLAGRFEVIPDKGKIFAAHNEILHDEEVLEMIETAIIDEQNMPDYAVQKVFTFFMNLMSKVNDPLIAARAADYRDICNRLIRILHQIPEKDLSALDRPVILVARDLLPSETATLDRGNVLGIITQEGSSTSHTAIIANSYSIPAIVGVQGCTTSLADDTFIAMDALSGEVYVNPSQEELERLNEKRRVYDRQVIEQNQFLTRDCLTASGTRIDIGLNIASTEKLEAYQYADFVGLFRTEFLYMESDHLPDEEEQFAAYTKVLRNAQGRPVTLRTLDIGGDKNLSYWSLPKEQNPFLGNRALRLCFSNPDILMTQLRAALRASVHGDLWIMVPMVGSIEDIKLAKEYLEKAKRELMVEGHAFDKDVKFGIMIEIPSIAVVSDLAAQYVDFASIGTNDLCQYMCAVDRMNPELGDYYQPFSPGVLRVLRDVIQSFNQAGKPISVCGELAGDPMGALLLIGMGLRKLSMSQAKMVKVKAAVARLSDHEIDALLREVMALESQTDILALMGTMGL